MDGVLSHLKPSLGTLFPWASSAAQEEKILHRSGLCGKSVSASGAVRFQLLLFRPGGEKGEM